MGGRGPSTRSCTSRYVGAGVGVGARTIRGHHLISNLEHTRAFLQDVMSEDVFLGMGDKSPGSSDCTHMTVKIQFPGHRMKDLDLDVTKHKLRVESAKMFLAMYLPLPADSD